MTKPVKKIGRTIGTVICSIVLGILLLLVVYLSICQASNKLMYIGNYTSIRIISPSMEPTIPTGEYILVKKVDPKQVKEKDVIVFYSRDAAIYNKLNTHRVVDVQNTDSGLQFITKGDNNPVRDALAVPQADVTGQYVRNMKGLTAVAKLFANKLVFILVILIPALYLVVVSVFDFMKRYKQVKMDAMVAKEVERLKQAEAASSDNSDKSADTHNEGE